MTQIYEQEILVIGNQYYEKLRIVSILQDEVLVMVRDISDRRQIKIALRESEERFQALITIIFSARLQIQSTVIGLGST